MAKRINLEKFGISAHRRDELVSFTLQYPEWQARLRELRAVKALRNEGDAVQGGQIGNPTEAVAMQTTQYVGKVDAVERSVLKAVGKNESLYAALLRAVTQGLSYEAAQFPGGRALYYSLCAAYYVNLDRLT